MGTRRADAPPGLILDNVQVSYGDAVRAVDGVSLRVPPGEVVALLGANGAGKTSLIRAITGLLPLHEGRASGAVTFGGLDLLRAQPHDIVRTGIAQVPEGRRIFATLTVEENLRTGGVTRPREIRDRMADVVELFPQLADRLGSVAGYLSGGEQQMLAVGRALMAHPRLLVVDEPSLGLAPQVVELIFQTLRRLNVEGMSILLVEQNAALALAASTNAYILENGRIMKHGPSDELQDSPDVRDIYLGVADGGRRSFTDVSSRRRSTRWYA